MSVHAQRDRVTVDGGRDQLRRISWTNDRDTERIGAAESVDVRSVDTTVRRVEPQERQRHGENERARLGNKERRSRASAGYRREQGKYDTMLSLKVVFGRKHAPRSRIWYAQSVLSLLPDC